ncbi:MAG: hypothetical protein M1823_003513 [Watsoniomyces obsoletus]|nr:MAG: hypothetical protein M1823_003513 [Watsoniomyces obsoletus]
MTTPTLSQNPWDVVLKTHLALVEGQIKMFELIKGHAVTGSNEFQLLSSLIDQTHQMATNVKMASAAVAMGNVTLNLSVQNDPIGTALISNLILRPGENFVEMRATTNQTVVLAKVGQFPDRVLPVDIVGNSTVFGGRNLPYYEIPLRANRIEMRLNLANARRE